MDCLILNLHVPLENGEVACWGDNREGQVVSGSASDTLTTPDQVQKSGAGYIELFAQFHTQAVVSVPGDSPDEGETSGGGGSSCGGLFNSCN